MHTYTHEIHEFMDFGSFESQRYWNQHKMFLSEVLWKNSEKREKKGKYESNGLSSNVLLLL